MLRKEGRVLNKKMGHLAFLTCLFLVLLLTGTVIKLVPAQKNSFTNLGLKGFSVTEEVASYVYVTTKPNNQQGILYLANVTAFNASGKIASGISNSSGIVTFTDIPFGDVTFVVYAGSEYNQIIANQTVLISVESQTFELTCDRNHGDVSIGWSLIITASHPILAVSFFFLLLSTRPLMKKDTKTRHNHLSKEAGKFQFPRRKTNKTGE